MDRRSLVLTRLTSRVGGRLYERPCHRLLGRLLRVYIYFIWYIYLMAPHLHSRLVDLLLYLPPSWYSTLHILLMPRASSTNAQIMYNPTYPILLSVEQCNNSTKQLTITALSISTNPPHQNPADYLTRLRLLIRCYLPTRRPAPRSPRPYIIFEDRKVVTVDVVPRFIHMKQSFVRCEHHIHEM
jgi:hypothetical protein